MVHILSVIIVCHRRARQNQHGYHGIRLEFGPVSLKEYPDKRLALLQNRNRSLTWQIFPIIAATLLKYRMASSHIHSWLRLNHQLNFDIVLDDWLGPTHALICCDDCNDFALIHLIGWEGDRMQKRIFAVRDLSGAVVETFKSNISRDYCDLTRKQSETQALIHASARDASVIEISLPQNRICAISTQKCNPKVQDWQALDAEDYCHWHQYMMR